MNKRLRKKKRLGEFQEYGFALAWQQADGRTHDEDLAFFDELCALDENMMYGGTFGGPRALLFVTHCKIDHDALKRRSPCRSGFAGAERHEIATRSMKQIADFLRTKPFIKQVWFSPILPDSIDELPQPPWAGDHARPGGALIPPPQGET